MEILQMTLKEFKMVVGEFPELSLEKEKSFWYAFVSGCGDLIRNNIANYYVPSKLAAINPTVQLVYCNDIINNKKDLGIGIWGTMDTDSVDVLRNHFKESLYIIKQCQATIKKINSFRKQQELEKDFENETKK